MHALYSRLIAGDSELRASEQFYLTDDFDTRNLGCVSILLSSIWNSDVFGFANLALESGAWLRERRTNGSAGGVGYGSDLFIPV
ncbi:hypothetical protein TNCV_3096691 [Trichonephila clavipes]|nr:hypothetical protein TNCV_3096691 [Trichonephila clavipes]